MLNTIRASMLLIDACNIALNDLQINIMLKVVKQSLSANIYKQLDANLLAGATLHSMLTVGLISRETDLTGLGQLLLHDFEKDKSALMSPLNIEQLTKNISGLDS